jgi:hypothetical protein
MGQPKQKDQYTEEEMRSEIITTVERMDKSFLRVVHSMLRTYVEENRSHESDVLDYEEAGMPVFREEFLNEAKAIVAGVKVGDFVTLGALDKQHKAWLDSK